jgi:membrane fusion protein (multidrug efflux system)
MATAFTRTLRRLDSTGFKRPIRTAAVVGVVLGAWSAWGTLVHVTIYEVSTQARLEVGRAVHSVEAPAGGRVIESRMTLGQEVIAGEVLLRLDSDTQQFALREEREKLAALDPELAALQAQSASIAQARQDEARAAQASTEETRARLREAEATARYAEAELERLEKLRAERLIAERDYQQGRAEAQRQRAVVEGLKATLARIEQEHNTRDRDRAASLDQIQAQMARITGQSRGSQAAVQRLAAETERYAVRAPASGRLGEVASLRPGSVVQPGQRLGVVVPSGKLIAVAQFAPSAVIGRIRPGQSARLRLDGFPWAQYGTVPATVSRVGSEIRDGAVRVEFMVEPRTGSRITMEHGLPGSIEVALEEITPFTLLLRAAGALQAAPPPPLRVMAAEGGR